MPTESILATEREKKQDLAQGEVIAGNFEVEDIAGRGAFATVYRAKDMAKDNRFVALKILHASVQKKLGVEGSFARNPFLKVQLVCDRLKDPILCKVVKVGTTKDKLHYMVTEWAKGEQLAMYLRRQPKGVPLLPASHLIKFLARAVRHMHEHKVVHCDLTPSNMMIDASKAAIPRPKIIDFGIAKLEGEGSPTGEVRAGTPAYMSPEQAMGKETDRRTDVYSFSAIVYEILSGQRAIVPPGKDRPSGTDYIDYLKSSAPIPTRPLQEVTTGLPQATCDALHVGLRRDRSKRVSDVGKLIQHVLVPMEKAGLLKEQRTVLQRAVDSMRSLTGRFWPGGK
jgi:serine/threonine-protein kinase